LPLLTILRLSVAAAACSLSLLPPSPPLLLPPPSLLRAPSFLLAMSRFANLAARASASVASNLTAAHDALPLKGAASPRASLFFPPAEPLTVALAVLAVVASALIYEQLNYQRKKAGLPGPRWTIPVIGKFADSLNPSLEKYMEGWNSGPLSVASVFHM
jgi:hypothetical protein